MFWCFWFSNKTLGIFNKSPKRQNLVFEGEAGHKQHAKINDILVQSENSPSSPPNMASTFQAKNRFQARTSDDQYGVTRSYDSRETISHISIITKGDTIHSFCFTSTDQFNYSGVSTRFGRKKGLTRTKIDIVIQNEKLKGISGTFEIYESRKIITSLSFTTDGNKLYGPFGTKKGSPFSLVVKDHSFTRFRAHCGWLLDDIGVSLGNLPFTMIESITPWGGLGGENQYDYMGKGDISLISIKYEGGIRSIRFTSQDENGLSKTSRRIGGAGGDKTAEIFIDTKSEKLVGVSGTVGMYLDYLVITSLKFYTSANKSYGPFGGGEGTPFSYIAEEGSITGFYGRDGGLLDSIGLHVQVTPNLDLLVDEQTHSCCE